MKRVSLVLAIMACVVIGMGISYVSGRDSGIGEKVVCLLYDYDSVSELELNMELLKGMVSDDVYQRLTIDNQERTLGTYLKFKQNPVSVQIRRADHGYVLFSLENENISKGRVFCFFYRVDKGKIVWFEEGEFLAY